MIVSKTTVGEPAVLSGAHAIVGEPYSAPPAAVNVVPSRVAGTTYVGAATVTRTVALLAANVLPAPG